MDAVTKNKLLWKTPTASGCSSLLISWSSSSLLTALPSRKHQETGGHSAHSRHFLSPCLRRCTVFRSRSIFFPDGSLQNFLALISYHTILAIFLKTFLAGAVIHTLDRSILPAIS